MTLIDKIIKEYCVTEKATELASNHNQYTFKVHPDSNRIEIAKAIRGLFDVAVTRVNVLNRKGKTKRSRTQRGKVGRTASSKIAIVTVKEGDKIDLL